VDGEEPFLQANAAIRHRDSSNTGLGEKLGGIQKGFAQNYFVRAGLAIERKLSSLSRNPENG